jgi:hypothetical protein
MSDGILKYGDAKIEKTNIGYGWRRTLIDRVADGFVDRVVNRTGDGAAKTRPSE